MEGLVKATDNAGVIVSAGLAGGILALIFVIVFTKFVKAQDAGNEHMQKLADIINAGAKTFLMQEYKYLSGFCFVMFAFLCAIIGATSKYPIDGFLTGIAFIVGAILSAGSGYLGMNIATLANVRTTQACNKSLNAGLEVAFKSGAVMGLVVVGSGITGLSVLYCIFYSAIPEAERVERVWPILSGFGFGASAIALFARVGGGVFTKAADVGADLVGKVEASIPEDDPRNPAVIADNVGDNVGDVAGMGADLFESYVGSIIAACTLAVDGNLALSYKAKGILSATANGANITTSLVALPFWVAGFGVLCSLIGIFLVKTTENKDTSKMSKKEREEYDMELLEKLLWVIRKGIFGAGLLVVGFTALVVYLLFGDEFKLGYSLFGCVVVGLITGNVIGTFTEYCTSYSYRPTQSIAEKSDTGPATVIIQGLGVGMLSVVVPAMILVVCIIACDALAGIYGVSIAAVGMLSCLGVTLATDAYGPVADNAGGLAEMCEGKGVEDFVRDRTDALDALGNTTAASGKGFAIGSAVLTSVGLISAFMAASGATAAIDIKEPIVLCGILIGAMLPNIFAALTMLSVGKSAEMIILEVRQQFYDDDGILAGTSEPNYERCVAISTQAAIEEMLIPGLLAVFSPMVVGFLLGVQALAGMLIGSLTAGFMLAVTMSNAGGAWDNAKKYVEKGGLGEGKGKGTDYHKATVVGDTVGDPFKDTSGPALNILIKLMSVISLVLGPVFKQLEIEGANGPKAFYLEGTIIAVCIFVVVGLVCIFAQRKFNARAQAFRDTVEAKKAARAGADESGKGKIVEMAEIKADVAGTGEEETDKMVEKAADI